MLTEAEVVVLGVKRGRGEYEGRQYAFTKFNIIEKIIGSDENQKGLRVTELKGPYELFDSFSVVPGRYVLSTDFNGKSSTVVSAEYLENFTIELD